MQKYRGKTYVRGWQKLEQVFLFPILGIAGSPTDFLQNFTLSISSKIPTKSSKIQILSSQTTYRTPYRQNPLKSNISATSKPKNQTSISQKFTHNFKIILIYRHFYRQRFFQQKFQIIQPKHKGSTIKLHTKLSRQ